MFAHRLVIVPAAEGGYIALFPALPGCMTQGESAEETLANAIEAYQLWVETAQAMGRTVPATEEE